MGIVFAIHACAPNDRNGNPKRCYLLYDESGTFMGAVNEGYRGSGAIGASGLLRDGDEVRILAQIPTRPGFIRDSLNRD